MTALRQREGVSARALEFLVLCGSRANEVLGAQWSEVDLNNRIWIVPAARMKMREEHKVPLADAAIALLESLSREDGNTFIFIGSQQGRGLGHAAMGEALSRVRTGFTVHGFRSSFRTWAAERTNYPHEIAEAALAHQVADRVTRAYRRTTFFDRRRELMAAWAEYCSGAPITTTDNVVGIRA
jgi:integrase